MTCPVRIDVPNYVNYDPETTGGVQKLYQVGQIASSVWF